jgi:hypothetical protein
LNAASTPLPTKSARILRGQVWSDTGVLLIVALAKILLHTLINNQYGFHRDELATIDDAHYLAWGYVAYPPFTPFIARIALELFGSSLVELRLFGALAGGAAVVLTGFIARELGGKRLAQGVAALAIATAPIPLASGSLFQYVAFDYLWWVLLAYLVVRLLNSDDSRWWVAIGAVIGFGMMTKYTMIFLVAGIVVGVLLTPMRHHLRSFWLWFGVGLSLLIFIPNVIWQVQHDFISLDFLRSIHARDIRIGRTDNFLVGQLLTGAGFSTIPIALAGLVWLFRAKGGQYRLLGWMFVTPLVLFAVARGRNYYQGPAYPMLFAGGAIWLERWIATLTASRARFAQALTWTGLAANAVLGIALLLPVWPVKSSLWNVAIKVSDDLQEEIGWPELVQTIANVRDNLPIEDRAHVGILAGNYGEAGAINLYGAAYGLPTAISGINSYWLRGFGATPPQTLIVIGLSASLLNGSSQREGAFESCTLAGHIANHYGVMNEEARYHPDVFVCRNLRESWSQFWKKFRYFG